MICYQRIEKSSAVSGEDIADINRLLEQLSEKARPVDADAVAAVVREEYLFLARDPELKNGIVGMATLSTMRFLGGRGGYVDDVVVDERYRGQGVGRNLMSLLISTAKGMGLSRLDLTSRPSRTEANILYQHLGFEKRETNCYCLKL